MPELARSTVFGLDVCDGARIRYLNGARARPTGRTVEVLLDRSEVARWPAGARLISAQERPDGSHEIGIEADAERGFLLSGPRYGRHVLCPQGRHLRCMPDGAGDADWQRFVIAQVLPFAAALQGLEVLHASGVSFGGRVVALAGPSGAGKTSLALAACRLGATLLADDVLALERDEGLLLAHPGAPLAGVARAEARRLGGRLDRTRVLASDERECVIETRLAAAPLPLRAVLLLDRRPDGPSEPAFEPVEQAGALLASTFNFVLDHPARLVRLLDVCQLVCSGTVRRLRVGTEVDADRLALAVADWFQSLP